MMFCTAHFTCNSRLFIWRGYDAVNSTQRRSVYLLRLLINSVSVYSIPRPLIMHTSGTLWPCTHQGTSRVSNLSTLDSAGLKYAFRNYNSKREKSEKGEANKVCCPFICPYLDSSRLCEIWVAIESKMLLVAIIKWLKYIPICLWL